MLMCRVLSLMVLVFRGDLAKDAELLVLRHENAVLRRQGGRVGYEVADRAWFAAVARLVPRRRWAVVFPVTPATLLVWHRGLMAREVRHEQAPQARTAAGTPQHRPSRRPPGVGESAAGAPPHPRRVDQARREGRAVRRAGDPACGGHRPGTSPVRADVAPAPGSPGCRNPRGRFPARGHGLLLRRLYVLVFTEHGTPPYAPGRRHRAPDRRLDSPAGPQPRSHPRRAVRGHQVPHPRPRTGLHHLLRHGLPGRRCPDRAHCRPGPHG